MGDNERVLKFQYKGRGVGVQVDVDKCNLLDAVIEYEDKARENGYELPRYPEFAYLWKMKQWPLIKDKDLMTMFERIPNREETFIWVGSSVKPNELSKLVLQLRKSQRTNSPSDVHNVVGMNIDNPTPLASIIPNEGCNVSVLGTDGKRQKLPVRRSKRNVEEKGKSVADQNDNADRVATHFEKYVVEEKDDDINLCNEETWAEIEQNIPEYDEKAYRKFCKEMEKKEKEIKKKAKGKKKQPILISNEPVVTRRSPRFCAKATVEEVIVESSAPQTSPTEEAENDTPQEGTAKKKTPIRREVHQTDFSLYERKIPRTTARRKGLVVCSMKASKVTVTDTNKTNEDGRTLRVRRRLQMENTNNDEEAGSEDDSDEEDYQPEEESESSDSDGTVVTEETVYKDELGGEINLPEIEDRWEPHKWHDLFDDEDDDDYFSKLYRNGELYNDKEFGKIQLRPWMIFTDKSHLKDVLKDYCVQEGFAITVLWADRFRYTATCAAKCCDWRVHASRLPDGRTWAIKKIWPNFHACRGLETYNPICTTKWAASKLMEDIRANPDIKGKELNEILFQRYGLYMKQSTMYKMKNYVIKEIFGGHDKSFGLLPAYVRVIHETNPNSMAFCAVTDIGHPQRAFQFSSIFISFEAQVKGFKAGCRSLIGVDGAHLKGNYGGILLSAIGLDANNEIFPLAYAVVSVEDTENWSFFFHHLHNLLKDDDRDNWTIISDRQKGVDLALKDVWPKAKRRYCCRHLSRNFKKAFPGPLMYILFWRACNANNPFNFKKAMERLRKEGKTPVMKWLAEIGNQCTWTKHKFDTSVCCDSNTSNFVESFNSTLGVDRCRPVLTLLEGIRRVCMVRIATRQKNAMEWDEEGICPKIAKLVKEIGQSTKFCRSHMSAPGEFEIHEGNSQFPLSLNKMKCACGAWQLTGIPCRHAVRAIKASKLDPYKYVSPWYSVKKYKATYSSNIAAMPDNAQWPEYEDLPTVLPPPLKRGIGRPSRNRRREEGEEAKGKRSRTVKCKNCGHFGHNMRTCKGAPTAKELLPNEPVARVNKRKRDQSSKGKQSKKATEHQEEMSQSGSQPQSLSQLESNLFS